MAILSGVLQVLPFPIAGPVPVWRTAFCWIALVPLLAALSGSDVRGGPLRIGHGAALGYCSGIVWYLGNCYWIYPTMHLYGAIPKPLSAGILLLFCLYLGLYHALFGALVVAFRRCNLRYQAALLLAPFAWVAVELARARITSFPWDQLGITQVDNPLLTHLAPFTGAYGLSFIVAAVNVLWLAAGRPRQKGFPWPGIAIASLAVALLSIPLKDIHKPAHEDFSATATLVQDNLEVGAENRGPQLTKGEMLTVFAKLSEYPGNYYCDGLTESSSARCYSHSAGNPSARLPARASSPLQDATDLIVWPEAPTPFEDSDPEFRAAMSALARAEHAPIIVGNIGIDADRNVTRGYDLFNSADFVRPDGVFAGRYDKMHLVPFGEYVPYKKLFFFAGNLLADVGEFNFGSTRSVFKTGGHAYGTFICYESIFADEVRQFEDLGADALVNISDDGWYGDTSAAWEHLNMVRMRAIENHRWVLRATNTGITASIDPYGRVVASAPRHIRTSLRVGFGYEHDITFYAAHGDLFAYLCSLVTALGLGFSLARISAPRRAA